MKYLETASSREAFKYFLRRELARHLDDVFKIQQDLALMDDVEDINEPLEAWIEAKRKEDV